MSKVSGGDVPSEKDAGNRRFSLSSLLLSSDGKCDGLRYRTIGLSFWSLKRSQHM
jgi:hypothetical protein